MLIYCICRAEFATDLNASGFAGRWNLDRQWVIYASATRSLAALEQMANRGRSGLSMPYRVMAIDVPSTSIHTVSPEMLPTDWRLLSGYGRLQDFGARWYRRMDSLLLSVPSVLVPQEYNYLIHTKHPDFCSKVRLVGVEDFNWDRRLTV